MDEKKVRELLEQLYVHTAAMPWADKGFVKSEVYKEAAANQIIDHILREIMNLSQKDGDK